MTSMLLLPEGHDADTLPAGWRPSTACWTRKAIQIADPNRYLFFERGTGEVVDFDRGIGQRGHDIEALVLGRVFGLSAHGVGRVLIGEHLQRGQLACGGKVATQVKLPLPFGGVSHIDWVVTDSPNRGLLGTWEHKSSTRDTLPTREHYEVVHLRQLLAERAGMDLPKPWRLLITDPASYRVHGPFTVTLNDQRRDELGAKLARLGRVLHRLDEIDLNDPNAFEGLECSCSQCFEPCGIEQAGDLNALLSLYKHATETIEAGGDPDDVAFARDEQAALKEQIRSMVGPGVKHPAPCGWQVRTSNPRVATKTAWDKADQAGLLTATLGEDGYAQLRGALQREGYVKTEAPKPSLYIERIPAVTAAA